MNQNSSLLILRTFDIGILCVSLLALVFFGPFLLVIALMGNWAAPLALTTPIVAGLALRNSKQSVSQKATIGWHALLFAWVFVVAAYFGTLLFGFLR